MLKPWKQLLKYGLMVKPRKGMIGMVGAYKKGAGRSLNSLQQQWKTVAEQLQENDRKSVVYGEAIRGGELTTFDNVSRHVAMIRNDKFSRR